MITRVLQKIMEDQAEAILVIPVWHTQSWWPKLITLVKEPGYLLPSPQTILQLPHKPEYRHPLKKMRMAVFNISGKPYTNKVSRNNLLKSLLMGGELPPEPNMPATLSDG